MSLEEPRMSSRYSEPLFVISVAARLVEMHPQTLRKYEREGLVAPSRTSGNLRLYSDSDIEQLRQVKYLVEQCGLNLAGVQLALELTRELRRLATGLRATNACRPATHPGARRHPQATGFRRGIAVDPRPAGERQPRKRSSRQPSFVHLGPATCLASSIWRSCPYGIESTLYRQGPRCDRRRPAT